MWVVVDIIGVDLILTTTPPTPPTTTEDIQDKNANYHTTNRLAEALVPAYVRTLKSYIVEFLPHCAK